MNLDVPMAEKQRFQPAHLGASKTTKQPSGTDWRSTATNIQEVKIPPETTGIKIVRGFPRLLQANDVKQESDEKKNSSSAPSTCCAVRLSSANLISLNH